MDGTTGFTFYFNSSANSDRHLCTAYFLVMIFINCSGVTARSMSPMPESIPTRESEIGVGVSLATVSSGCAFAGTGNCIITFVRPVGIWGGTSINLSRSPFAENVKNNAFC